MNRWLPWGYQSFFRWMAGMVSPWGTSFFTTKMENKNKIPEGSGECPVCKQACIDLWWHFKREHPDEFQKSKEANCPLDGVMPINIGPPPATPEPTPPYADEVATAQVLAEVHRRRAERREVDRAAEPTAQVARDLARVDYGEYLDAVIREGGLVNTPAVPPAQIPTAAVQNWWTHLQRTMVENNPHQHEPPF